ncbi:hypothetical protein CLV30_11037 [Haloactinopolyspora alba]|uniref:Alpha/beta hydrolase family protein n=1 Tax=Haloactinopolyspora alba TaxID=648780 RepID=A0A2P8DYT8_9ACTN|nr:hypothetical protein [Haloactinopolyspora alba]PSL02384.1 hypothetical protein CLV30_11037 [Haloactinopolyspora alba]
MKPGALVLVSGPLDRADHWQQAGVELGDHDVVTPPSTADGPPYAVAWIASLARPLHARRMRDPLVLIGHGTAGPLLPALARTQRAGGRGVGGYVFVDAALPRPGAPSFLDLLRAADADVAESAHEALHAPGAGWPPDAPRPRGHDFWTEPLPAAPDWPDAPCAYVRTGSEVPGTGPTSFWARSAHSRGWRVLEGADLSTLLADAVDALPG